MLISTKLKQAVRFIYQAARSRTPRVAYIGGWSGHSNLGDEALSLAVRSLFSSASFVDYPRGLELGFSKRFLSRIQLGILAGGTLIGPKIGATDYARKLLTECPCPVVFGTGVVHPDQKFTGPKFYAWPQWGRIWTEVLKSCRYVGVRGPLSAEVLVDCGLDLPEVIGDPVLFFAEDRPPIDSACRPNTIGLNIGQTSGFMWGDPENLSKQYIELASVAKKSGWQVKWFVVWPKDMPVTKRAAVASGTDEKIYRVYHNPSKFLDLIKQVTVFVGMKLHSVILASCAYVPSIMVEYQTKCRDYMMAVDQQQFCVRPDVLNIGELWEKIRFIGARRREFSDNLFRKVQQLRNRQFARADELSRKYLNT